MKRSTMLARISAMLLCAAVTMTGDRAVAQQKSIKEQLVGTWRFNASVDLRKGGGRLNRWGPNPAGIFMFDAKGRFAQMIMRTSVRTFGAKTVASFGTYTVNEADKTILTHVEGSSVPSFIGIDEKRAIISLTADELKYNNPSTTAGTSVVAIWKRVN